MYQCTKVFIAGTSDSSLVRLWSSLGYVSYLRRICPVPVGGQTPTTFSTPWRIVVPNFVVRYASIRADSAHIRFLLNLEWFHYFRLVAFVIRLPKGTGQALTGSWSSTSVDGGAEWFRFFFIRDLESKELALTESRQGQPRHQHSQNR